MGTTCLFILIFLVAANIAVPLQKTSRVVKRDEESTRINTTLSEDVCIHDNVEYKAGDEVQSLGPCESCMCIGSKVQCSMIKCQLNSGCRIIQQSGQCCPEYKCDCEYNGKIYNNGERLDKPEDPCQVCYCKGGEIMCTSITCYERDDCKPHFSPGQCCPRYDHCPIDSNRMSSNSVRSVNASLYSPKREMQPWPLTRPSNAPSSVNYDETSGFQNNVYPQTIKIVEILPTTPSYTNKPSEVSVIPRVKTNEKSDSKGQPLELVEDVSTSKSMTTEMYDSSSISDSTSEIEHLVDTNFTSDSLFIKEEIPERTVSTLNPLSEYIGSANDSLFEPDSQNVATIHPGYNHSESGLNNLEEGTTAESVTVTEGSGYEILSGGIYEDNSYESSVENTTGTDSLIHESTINYDEDIFNQTNDSPKFEGYTATKSINNEEIIHTTTDMHEISTLINDTTSKEVDSSDENSEKQNEYKSSALKKSEDSSSAESSSEETDIYEYPVKNTTDNAEAVTENKYSSTSENSKLCEPGTTDLEDITESNTASDSDKLISTTESSFSTGNTLESLRSTEEIISSTTKELELSTPEEILTSTTFSSSANEESAPTHEASEINESTTNYEFLKTSNERNMLPEGRMKSSRLRTVDSGNVNNEKPSTLTFPSMLNVHTLGYNQMSPHTETTQLENVTAMAKVGIYHPAKANELAGYLTVVDDKANISTVNGQIISSHMLLTPNDLKKLAEILIHEKIKPAYDSNEEKANPETTYDNVETSTNLGLSENINTQEDISDATTVNNVSHGSDSLEDMAHSTIKNIDETLEHETKAGLGTFNNYEQNVPSNDEPAEFPVELVRNLVSSGALGKELIQESYSDDPNTSRQIRNPINDGEQYSAPLDDRDMLILADFFRKNMGFQ